MADIPDSNPHRADEEDDEDADDVGKTPHHLSSQRMTDDEQVNTKVNLEVTGMALPSGTIVGLGEKRLSSATAPGEYDPSVNTSAQPTREILAVSLPPIEKSGMMNDKSNLELFHDYDE